MAKMFKSLIFWLALINIFLAAYTYKRNAQKRFVTLETKNKKYRKRGSLGLVTLSRKDLSLQQLWYLGLVLYDLGFLYDEGY